MKLVTKALENQFKKTGHQGNNPDPIVVAKFFNPTGSGTWYATEMTYVLEEVDETGKVKTVDVPASEMNGRKGKVVDMIFYGYVSIFGDWNDEWGDFSLSELQSVRGRFGLGIERDLGFEPKPISKVCAKAVSCEAAEDEVSDVQED